MDVDLDRATLAIRRSKTDAGHRLLPLNADARAALQRLSERAAAMGTREPNQYMFPTCEGGVIDATRPQKSWRSAWRSLTTAAGMRGLRFHDLRHQAITEMAEAGASDATIMAITWHVDRSMMEHYSHVRMLAKREVVAKMESGLMGGEDGRARRNLPVN